MKNKKHISSIYAVLLVIFGVVGRLLLVNVPNVSSLESLALFGGAFFALKRYAFLIPIAAYFVSDFIINNVIYSAYFPDGLVFFGSYMLWTIPALLLIVLIGKGLLKNVTLKNTVLGVLSATTIFWLISNFGSFVTMPIYSKDISGLISCYVAAVPFYKYSLIGNAAFAAILFGGYQWVSSRKPEFALN